MNQELRKKFPRYSAAAIAAMAAGTTAEAQIVYNQVNKTINAPTADGFVIDSIDINVDGDFDLAMVIYTANGGAANLVLGGPINNQGHAMAGSIPSSYNYPFRLNNGAQINTQAFLPNNEAGSFTVVVNGNTPYNSFWNDGVTDGYLGVRLNVAGNTHYGWVRMDMAANGKQVVIKDMAFNSTVNGAITAGQGQLSVPEMENILAGVWVAQRELITDIQAPFEQGTLQLFDLQGKVAKEVTLNAPNNRIDLSDLAVGAYVLTVRVDGYVLSKKVMVQ
jgi:hypothetical protein